jgi:hypothetical protein
MPHATVYATGFNARRLIMKKSLRAHGRESSRKTFYGFQRGTPDAKKRAAVSGGF